MVWAAAKKWPPGPTSATASMPISSGDGAPAERAREHLQHFNIEDELLK